MSNGKTISAGELCARLRTYYPSNEWALLFEVRGGTGYESNRYADAIAMNTWPSRHYIMVGLEIKVNRYDLQKELRNPAKADVVGKFCDFFYIVAPEDIVKFGELPNAWGHLAPKNSNTLKIVKQAAKNPDVRPLTKSFIASFLRNAGRVDEAEVRSAVEGARKADKERIEAEIERRVKWATQDHDHLKRAVEAFEASSGLKLGSVESWASSPKELGAAVAAVKAIGIGNVHRGVRDVLAALKRCTDDVEKAISQFNQGGQDDGSTQVSS